MGQQTKTRWSTSHMTWQQTNQHARYDNVLKIPLVQLISSQDGDICRKPWYASACDRKTADDVLFRVNKVRNWLLFTVCSHGTLLGLNVSIFCFRMGRLWWERARGRTHSSHTRWWCFTGAECTTSQSASYQQLNSTLWEERREGRRYSKDLFMCLFSVFSCV